MNEKENIKTRTIIANVKGEEFKFNELYCIDPITGEEIFNREIEIENDINLYDLYKSRKNLLTSKEIINIRKKYSMNQKDFAFAIGLGEVTINRFENGAIQSEAINSMLKLCNDPDNMLSLLLNNHSNLTEKVFENHVNKIKRLKEIKEHKIAEINKKELINLSFNTINSNDVAKKIIEVYNENIDNIHLKYDIEKSYNEEYITQLKLQKLLYYVQGIALMVYNEPAFNSGIYNWSYGPVIKDIYNEYKKNGKDPIVNSQNNIEVSEGLLRIIEIVIESYGQMEALKLIEYTNKEDPWLNTVRDSEIPIEKIKEYFDLVYC